MFLLILIIQITAITIMLTGCILVFNKWNGMLHSWMFFSLAAILVNNVGYLVALLSKTREAYLAALKMSYFGRIWVPLALFCFAMEVGRIRIPKVVETGLALMHAAVYVIVFTMDKHELYYAEMRFANGGVIPKLTYKAGIIKNIYMMVIIAYIVIGIICLIRAYKKECFPMAKKRIICIILSLCTEGGIATGQMLKLFPMSEYYDFTMLGYVIGALFMFIAIVRYNLLDTEKLAREFVVDELSEGIIAVDEQDRVDYYNKPAVRLFPAIENHEERVLQKIREALQADTPIRIGERVFVPEENPLIQDGIKVGTVYALTDETEHFQYMEDLREQTELAERANKTKSMFLANMSHEIRTPINAILGMDEMILRESREKDTLSYAGDIRNAGRTLLTIINDILDFSKVEEGRMEILPTQYELCSLINDLVNMTRPRAEKKGLSFHIAMDEEIPHILIGDEIRIRQCALNILTNAVKYTEKGSVDFALHYRKVSDDSIDLIFQIKDTGIGMKEEDMDRLFSPFSRIEESRNRNVEGTGLGMSIVKELLALMDSRLTVHSVYGEGSEFSFELRQKVVRWEPIGSYADQYLAEQKEGSSYRELFHAPDARILIVDDNEVNLRVAVNLLKRTKIRVDTAMSGGEALELVRKVAYDVVFLDHMMPEMDGLETLRRMREEGIDQPVFIALTANAVSGARQMYMDAGFADYLSKPVDGERLEEMLKKSLPEEKVLPVSSQDEQAGEAEKLGAPDSALPEWIRDIPELDIRDGVHYGNSEEGFLSILSVFHQTAAAKSAEIEQLYRDNEFEEYTIRVHALKSSARVIGAHELSELARTLEDAGKAGDTGFIREHTDELLAKYRELDHKLARLDESEEEQPEISEAGLNEAYMTMSEIAGSLDYGLMEELIRNLKGYRLNEEDKERIGRIEERLMELDWEGIQNELRRQ